MSYRGRGGPASSLPLDRAFGDRLHDAVHTISASQALRLVRLLIIRATPIRAVPLATQRMRIRRMRIKICLVGDRGVGKTSLIKRYAADKFYPKEQGTLGARMYPIDVEIPLEDGEVAKVKVALFDFMGEHAMRENFRDALFYGTHGGIAVCDLSRRDTLYSLSEWVEALSAVTGGVPLAVLMNKADLAQSVAIGAAEMRWFHEQFPHVPTHLTSARTGQGVEPAFNQIIARTVDSLLDARRKDQANRALRLQILSAIANREKGGLSKKDLLEAFKGKDPKDILGELSNLVSLDLVEQKESGEKAFVQFDSIPVTFRFTLTGAGRKAVADPQAADAIIDEPV
jgi:small GTP-binding protein